MHIPPSQSLWECGKIQGGESQTLLSEKTIKNYSLIRSWIFGIKLQLINMVKNWAFNISLESSWNLNIESGFLFSIWNYELKIVAKRMVRN
jgi:hypothetical protein